MKHYGKELILDLHNCDISKFDKKGIQNFFDLLCKKIKMEQVKSHWWTTEGLTKEELEIPHLRGTSAIQFIKTSNVTIHTLELMGCCYINIFSCKNFNVHVAENFAKKYFKATVANSVAVARV